MNTFVILLSALCVGIVFARSGYVFASWLHFNSRCRPLFLPWFFIPVIVAACMGTIHPIFVCMSLEHLRNYFMAVASV